MDLSFNELCLNNEVMTVEDADLLRKQINRFVEFLHSLKQEKLLSSIICMSGILDKNESSSSYGFKEWLEDSLVERKYKDFFRSTWNKTCGYIEATDFDSEFRITIDGKDYLGIGSMHAAETGNTTLSISTNEIFKQDKLHGIHVQIDADSNINEGEKSIDNFFEETSINKVEEVVRYTHWDKISSGQDLWENREKIFPNLIFCDSVKAQLYKDPEKHHIEQVMRKLNILQEYFEDLEGIYSLKDLGFDARTESDTVKKNGKLKKEREFTLPDGSKEYFFDHISFTGKFTGGRIYFKRCGLEKVCYIGYIGRHLPTKFC